jgi:hypothetical protein
MAEIKDFSDYTAGLSLGKVQYPDYAGRIEVNKLSHQLRNYYFANLLFCFETQVHSILFQGETKLSELVDKLNI